MAAPAPVPAPAPVGIPPPADSNAITETPPAAESIPVPAIESTAAPAPEQTQTELVEKRTGDTLPLTSQADSTDARVRFSEKKRLHWKGKTCTSISLFHFFDFSNSNVIFTMDL